MTTMKSMTLDQFIEHRRATAPGERDLDQFAASVRADAPNDFGDFDESAEDWAGLIARRSATSNTNLRPPARRSSASTGSGAAMTESYGWSTAVPTGAG